MNQEKTMTHKVLILGNGFDLAVGRRTRYKDFYESQYCPKDYPASLIAFLNEKWGNNLEDVRWLDLETALQEYAKNPSKNDYCTEDEIEFIKHHDYEIIHSTPADPIARARINICNTLLRKGILTQNSFGIISTTEKYIEFTKLTRQEREEKALKEIEDGLAKYLNEIGERSDMQKSDAVYLLREALAYNNSSVYSFNYTRIGSLITDNEEKVKEYDSKVQYIHGSLQEGHIIIGAKDGNYGNYDFIQKAFDEKYNSSSLLEEMQMADEIIIYGHSLGDCDSQYFGPFFKSIVDGTQPKESKRKQKITIYTYDLKSEIQIKKNLNILTDWHLSWLYSKCDINIIKTVSTIAKNATVESGGK